MKMSDVVFDEGAALNRTDNDADLLAELVKLFFDEYEQKILNFRQVVASKDMHAVVEAAHSMKSALGNLGAVRAYGAASDLERFAQEMRSDIFASGLAALESEVSQFRIEVKGRYL